MKLKIFYLLAKRFRLVDAKRTQMSLRVKSKILPLRSRKSSSKTEGITCRNND